MARAETERETAEVPPIEQQVTVAIERERLLELIDRTSAPPVQHAHVVPRERLRDREPWQRPADELDTDISPSLSPLLVLGVIALLLVVFVAATQLR